MLSDQLKEENKKHKYDEEPAKGKKKPNQFATMIAGAKDNEKGQANSSSYQSAKPIIP